MNKIYLLYKKMIVFLYKKKIIKNKFTLLQCIPIDFYAPEWEFIHTDFLFSNIILEIEFLKSINKLDLTQDRITAVVSKHNKSFSQWYTDNGFSISNDVFYIWLKEVRKVISLHNTIQTNNHIAQYNSIKLKAIQNDYTNIINYIFSALKI